MAEDVATPGGALARWLIDLGFDSTKSFEAAQLLVQVSLSLLGGIIVAILAYWLIHSNQIRAARDGRKIERARLLHDLDREYFDLMARRCLVRSRRKPRARYGQDELWNLEYALTASVIWYPKMELTGDQRIYHSVNHSRFVRIHDEWIIDTLVLHHVAAWARRIGNGVEAGILDKRDVAGLWRNILPWARDNRLSFMMDLFGSTAMTRLAAAGTLKPRRQTPEAYVRAAWPLRGLGRLSAGLRWLVEASAGRLIRWLDAQRTLRRLPPETWPADLEPLYRCIHTVVSQSIIHGHLDALDYAHLIGETTADRPDRLDPQVRRTLLQPVPLRAT
jgi:hypothetical protein